MLSAFASGKLGFAQATEEVLTSPGLATPGGGTTFIDTLMNSIFVIKPYRYLGMWVFDDAKRGIIEEPFVSGADTLIDLVVKDVPNADAGFAMLFSADEFPDAHIHLEWRRSEKSGNTYWCETLGHEGWLCPALLKYFSEPPKNLYVKIQAIPAQ